MREVLQMPAISRSFKVNVVRRAKHVPGVDLYRQSGADQLRNTCSCHILFAQNEQKIAEDISRSIGNRTRKKLTYSSGEQNITRNTGEAKEGVPLVLSRSDEPASI